jgi:hypothetical protein
MYTQDSQDNVSTCVSVRLTSIERCGELNCTPWRMFLRINILQMIKYSIDPFYHDRIIACEKSDMLGIRIVACTMIHHLYKLPLVYKCRTASAQRIR